VRELSIFVDESGDFGALDVHSPFYLLTFVFHDQANSISEQINWLNQSLQDVDLPFHTIHAGPILRKEGMYAGMDIDARRRVLKKLYRFVRISDFSYRTFLFEKRTCGSGFDLSFAMAQELGLFIREYLAFFQSFDRTVIYYDYGQWQISELLTVVFGAVVSQGLEMKHVSPADYRLFQVADYLCMMELIEHKRIRGLASRTEQLFFGKRNREFRTIIKTIRTKWLH
jgi:hypothetical protein